jgi:hypothetical protein
VELILDEGEHVDVDLGDDEVGDREEGGHSAERNIRLHRAIDEVHAIHFEGSNGAVRRFAEESIGSHDPGADGGESRAEGRAGGGGHTEHRRQQQRCGSRREEC